MHLPSNLDLAIGGTVLLVGALAALVLREWLHHCRAQRADIRSDPADWLPILRSGDEPACTGPNPMPATNLRRIPSQADIRWAALDTEALDLANRQLETAMLRYLNSTQKG